MSTIDIVTRPDLVRERVCGWRKRGLRVALVPTMGNLHQGHAMLVTRAHELADKVVVSIFVNPLQFGPNEDFDRYPRTPEQDHALLEAHRTDLLFAPGVQDMYPPSSTPHTVVTVPELSSTLCGAVRPGHFAGVATVVAKLFNSVVPDVAVFGEKDFQQLTIIRRMVKDLGMPLEIVGVPTVREANGLAMSSRNRYLSDAQRQQAGQIYANLIAVAESLKQGRRDYGALEQRAVAQLERAGFKVDYVSIRDADDLQPPKPQSKKLVALAAAHVGKARLIDNVQVVV